MLWFSSHFQKEMLSSFSCRVKFRGYGKHTLQSAILRPLARFLHYWQKWNQTRNAHKAMPSAGTNLVKPEDPSIRWSWVKVALNYAQICAVPCFSSSYIIDPLNRSRPAVHLLTTLEKLLSEREFKFKIYICKGLLFYLTNAYHYLKRY